MQLWMILVLIALVLWLLSLVRMGASVEYDSSGLLVAVRVGPVKFTVFPLKKKDKLPKRRKKEKKPEPVEAQLKKKGGNLALVQKFLPLAAEAAGRFKEKIRIDNIDLELVWGSPDPAAAAIGYGFANAALGMLWPLLAHNFNIRERQICISMDYSVSIPAITIRAALSLTIGQCVVLGVVLGFKALILYRSHRKEIKLKEV